ncbi:galactose oxidase [Mytilinidion resinicola]|uniref:Galactose oxidase n=1 Tax=Mytilinidion resinicola TaxID=574789 RepID=A0A6A6Z8P5_9PEZI|nr:galactose oxidase [Mytilinidion resinicola]KAF2817491.1 galactose oxidase [Mytilinidion resinicola]
MRNSCKAALTNEDFYPRSFRRDVTLYSTNSRCGPNYGNILCDDTTGDSLTTCCSQYGWCGVTPAHCGKGCSSGCRSIPANKANAIPRASYPSSTAPPGRCGKDFGGATCDPNGGYGGCCSQYGYCGTTPGHCGTGCQSGCSNPVSSTPPSVTTSGEPVLGKPSSTISANPSATGKPTNDGSCGINFGGTVCGDWHDGACCSMYGYCGNTTAHCGDGCQSGPCLGGPVVPAPGPSPAPANPNPGSFKVVGKSGVPAMHAGLLPNGRVVFLDKVENFTNLKLPNGQFAYSSEYNPQDNSVVPLAYKTNAFCAGGIFLADGQFLALGGNAPLAWMDPTVGDGFTGIRYLNRSATDYSLNGKDWNEPGNKLNTARWYPSAQVMPDGSIFVASGSLNGLDPSVKANNNPTYEMLDTSGISNGQSISMDILVKTQPYFMYPFIHLLNDGSLFVFVSKSSELFNVTSGKTIRNFADLPGDFRTYPNTGGSVLLPLSSDSQWNPDVIICGGGAYQDITSPTDPSCGRIRPLDADPSWEMDSMPEGRGMVEGTLLPDGTVIFLNGCNKGAQGFGLAAAPTFEALIYDPAKSLGQRWTTGARTDIPRLYHSVALLLLDGTLMIAGSNPVEQPVLSASPQNPFITEFRVEIYTPPYLQGDSAKKRPTDVTLTSTTLQADGSSFGIQFNAPTDAKGVKVALYYGGFVTHSVHMGHRMAFLDNTGFKPGASAQELTVKMPPTRNIAPPGPYVVYVLVDGVPAVGQFVQVS